MPKSHCFHCAAPLLGPQLTDPCLSTTLAGQVAHFCCVGCLAVAQTIHDGGLARFYQQRQAPSQPVAPASLASLRQYDEPALQQAWVRPVGALLEMELAIEGLTCAACAWLIERHLLALPGVTYLCVNSTTARARLRWDNTQVALSAILSAMAHLGFSAIPFAPLAQEAQYQRQLRGLLQRLGLAGLGSMQVMMSSLTGYFEWFGTVDAEFVIYFNWISLLLAAPILGYCAQPIYQNAWRSLKLRHLSMDVSVSLALLAAFTASFWATLTAHGEVYFDSLTMFIFFLLCGRLLELRARQKALQQGNHHGKQLPRLARRWQHGATEQVVAAALNVGDEVLVHAGECVPADGHLCTDAAELNEAMLTGESLPVPKRTGDAVYAGALNGAAPFRFIVSAPLTQSRLSQVEALQASALSYKPRLAQLADRVARQFTAVQLLLTALVWAIWQWHDPSQAFAVALALLVATCPCALALATPTALTAATSALAGSGILLRRGHLLETLPKVTDVLFDKTGTLTQGEVTLSAMHALSTLPASACLGLAQALETHSEHPLARAFMRATGAQIMPAATNVTNVVGHGLSGVIDGRRYFLGHADWVFAQLGAPASAHLKVSPARGAQMRLWLADDSACLAEFVLQDALRAETGALIAALHAQGLRTHLLSGDPSEHALTLQTQLGMGYARHGASPAEKLAYVQQQAKLGAVALMVGDGINDAPVLAAAHCSFAVVGATALAKQSADGLLLGQTLSGLLHAIAHARRTQRIVRQNFAWALGYNALILPLAASGYLPPYLAAAGMSLSSLVVITNSLRLQRLPAPREHHDQAVTPA
ncbi:MAG: heavy metal translocating P-type ATPase [Aeromonas sp.]